MDWTAKGKARIAQNVRNLLNTYRYEVAYHRTMGLPGNLLDRPTPLAMEELKVEVRQLLARYEPRASVREISVKAGPQGDLSLEVELD